jgi:hypothetical protein
MAFETFKRQRAPTTREPAITIQKRGTFSLNAPAYEALDAPEFLELLYDREERLIGLRKADMKASHAYIVQAASGGNNYVVSGKAFLAYYEISFGTAMRWVAQQQDDMLVIDLKQPGAEVTGNRTRLMPGGSG